jgi:DNA-binding NtrC family response regulator
MLTLYDWPGNVRELRAALEHAFSTGRAEPVLYPIDLPAHIRIAVTKVAVGKRQSGELKEASEFEKCERPPWKTYRDSALIAVERQYFRDLLQYCDGDLQDACRLSGVGRTRLYELLKESGLIQPSKGLLSTRKSGKRERASTVKTQRPA